jgi:hypothetical protein
MTFYECFQNHELNKMIHPSLNNMEKDSLSFIIYKNENLVRFSDFDLVHNSECLFIICYYKIYLFMMEVIYFQNTTSIDHMYMNQCQIRGFLPNLESLQNFLHQYATRSLFEDKK